MQSCDGLAAFGSGFRHVVYIGGHQVVKAGAGVLRCSSGRRRRCALSPCDGLVRMPVRSFLLEAPPEALHVRAVQPGRTNVNLYTAYARLRSTGIPSRQRMNARLGERSLHRLREALEAVHANDIGEGPAEFTSPSKSSSNSSSRFSCFVVSSGMACPSWYGENVCGGGITQFWGHLQNPWNAGSACVSYGLEQIIYRKPCNICVMHIYCCIHRNRIQSPTSPLILKRT